MENLDLNSENYFMSYFPIINIPLTLLVSWIHFITFRVHKDKRLYLSICIIGLLYIAE